MNLPKKSEIISVVQSLTKEIVIERMQKYYLLINQCTIILLGVATIFIATEYQNFSLQKTDSGTDSTDTDKYSK